MVPRWTLIALVACGEPKREEAPPPPPVRVAIVIDAAPIDAAVVDAAPLDASLDAHEAPAAWMAKGSPDTAIATFWDEVATGKPLTHASELFVVEAFVPPEMFEGQSCGLPFMMDAGSPQSECLRRVVVNHAPKAWRDGWGCKGFSGTDLARSIQRQRVASKDRLRCGIRNNAAVFVAVDGKGLVSAFLVHPVDSR